MMLDDSAQSKLWRTSALNFNVRLFRLPSVLAAFLATPGGSESRSTHRGPKERPESASNEPTAAKTEQKVEPWTMSSNVNFRRTVENLISLLVILVVFFWHGSARASEHLHISFRAPVPFCADLCRTLPSLCGNWDATKSLRNSARKGETCAL